MMSSTCVDDQMVGLDRAMVIRGLQQGETGVSLSAGTSSALELPLSTGTRQTGRRTTVREFVSNALHRLWSTRTSLYLSCSSCVLPCPGPGCASLSFLLADDAFLPPGVVDPPARWSPARSRSESSHDKMVASRESISNRLGSARGVAMNWRRTLVTRRLYAELVWYKVSNVKAYRSTLTSDVFLRNRLSASVRCSCVKTATLGVSQRYVEG